MGMWGGGGGNIGGFSQNLGGGGGHQGPGGRMGRGADGWDDEELGKALDIEVIRRLLPYMTEYKLHAFFSLFTMILTAVAQYMQPLVLLFLVPAAIRGDTNEVLLWGGVMVGASLVYAIAQMTQQLVTAWIGTRVLRKLQARMYDHVQGLSLSFFDEMEVGRIISRLTSDVQVVQDLLTTGSLSSLSNVVGVTIIVGVLLAADWQLALVTFAVIPPLVIIMILWARAARVAFMQTRISISALYGNLAESISGVRAVQSMSREGENSRRFDKLNVENRNVNNYAAFLSSAVMPVIEICVALATAGVLLYGGKRAINADVVDVATLFGILTAFTVYV